MIERLSDFYWTRVFLVVVMLCAGLAFASGVVLLPIAMVVGASSLVAKIGTVMILGAAWLFVTGVLFPLLIAIAPYILTVHRLLEPEKKRETS